MEKQNITPGPWRAVNNGPHWNNKQIDNWEIQYSEAGECVVDHVYEEADAKAIAAVPEMIEALIGIVEATAPEFAVRYGFDHKRDQAITALRKAGVEEIKMESLERA